MEGERGGECQNYRGEKQEGSGQGEEVIELRWEEICSVVK